MKNEPDWRNSPPNASGWFHAACRAASAPRLCPISTGLWSLGYWRSSRVTAVPPSLDGYAGLAAYRSSRGAGCQQRDPHGRQGTGADQRGDVQRDLAEAVHLRAVVRDQHRQPVVAGDPHRLPDGGVDRDVVPHALDGLEVEPARLARSPGRASHECGPKAPSLISGLPGSMTMPSPATSKRYSRQSSLGSGTRSSQPELRRRESGSTPEVDVGPESDAVGPVLGVGVAEDDPVGLDLRPRDLLDGRHRSKVPRTPGGLLRRWKVMSPSGWTRVS